MSPDTSRWRFAEAYDYLDELPAADLAWEYLRRNPQYQDDFAQASLNPPPADWTQRWGLRFPCRSFA